MSREKKNVEKANFHHIDLMAILVSIKMKALYEILWIRFSLMWDVE